MPKARRFETRQKRMSERKFKKIYHYANFLSIQINRATFFNLISDAEFFAKQLAEMLAQNPRLRKKFPELEKSISNLDNMIHKSIEPSTLKNVGI